jgi:hypothetical protein
VEIARCEPPWRTRKILASVVATNVTLHGRGHESNVPTSMPVALTEKKRLD